MKKNVFIGSSIEGLDIAYAIQENLQFDFAPTVWDQGIFSLNSFTLDELTRVSREIEAAIIVFSPDDVVNLRDHTYQAARDNVILELGLFISALGKDKVFCVTPRGIDNFRIPTDLLGLNLGSYDSKRGDDNLNAALGPFCTQFKRKINAQHYSQTKTNVVLGTRGDLNRLETIIEEARYDILFAGVNLEIAIQLNSTLKRLAGRGVKIRLLSLDPNSNVSQDLSSFSDVDYEVRKAKIESNHKVITRDFAELILEKKVEVKKFKGILSVGSIAIDIDSTKGKIYIQQYLFKIKTDKLPIFTLETFKQPFWFDVYKTQLLATWQQSDYLK